MRTIETLACASALALVGIAATAQTEGGLYIADSKFGFETAAERALAQNRGGQRFFVLAVPPQAVAMTTRATRSQQRLRERVSAAGGVLLVCRRDLDNGRIEAALLAPGVVAVRGWPAAGSPAPGGGERLFPDESAADLPASNEALRRLRATCA